MSIAFGRGLTVREQRWTPWKALHAAKAFVYQHDDDGVELKIYGYDGPEVHICTIYKGRVPDGVIAGGYSQAQNDTDKSEWEDEWEAGSNATIQPRTSDGKPISLMNLFAGDVRVQHVGVGDDITTGVAGAGTLFSMESTAIEDKVITVQFKEWVYLAGGQGWVKGGVAGDHATFSLYAPATAGTSAPGVGAYGKQQVAAGVNRFIPVVGGDWNLNLTEKLSANVNISKVVPVPNAFGTGYFDWASTTETVTLASSGNGAYDLYDIEIPIWNHADKVPLYNGNFIGLIIPAVKVKRVLGQWKIRVTLHHTTTDLAGLAFLLFIGRA